MINLFSKLDVSTNVKNELITAMLAIKQKTSYLEKINEDCRFWCIEETGDHTFIDTEHGPISMNTSWEYIEKEISDLDAILCKYKLFKFFTMIGNHDFIPHRHLVRHRTDIGIWFIVFFENHGGELLFADPTNFQMSNEITMECSPFDVLPVDCHYNILAKETVTKGDLYLVNTWQWHTFMTDNKKANTLTLCVNTRDINEYISYLKTIP